MQTLVTDDLDAAAQVLVNGGVVLHATEGVWGFACDPMQPAALSAVLELKQRDSAKGLILIAADEKFFRQHLAAVPDRDHYNAILASWPGPHTWILPNCKRFSEVVTGGRGTVACRVPGHQQARSLCAAFGGVLVSTSANISGQSPVLTFSQAEETFNQSVDCIVEGAVMEPGRASTIHALDGTLLRK